MLTAATGTVELDERDSFSVSRLDHIHGEVHRLGTLAIGSRGDRQLRDTLEHGRC
jgi:hypothetical protein